jgi:predicted phosphodiesterase
MGTNSVCLTCLWEDETGVTVDRSKKSKDWAEEVGVGSSSIRRHWKHIEETQTLGGRLGITVDDAARFANNVNDFFSINTPYSWEPIHSATPVIVEVPFRSPQPPRELRLAIKGADAQIGFRILADGSTEAFHDEAAMDLFIQVCAEYQPDKIQLLGDMLDLPSQSRWAKEASFAQTTQPAIDYFYTWLAKLRAVCPTAEIVIVEGNHDKRMQNFVELNTLATFGLKRAGTDELPVMSVPYLLRLDELDIRYVDAYPAATDWDNATTRNIHGTRANSVGSTTSQYIKELPHINTWAGHTHRAEITFKSVVGHYGNPVESYSANPGCLCKTDGTVPSVKGAIHSDGHSARTVEDWQQGIGFLYYSETDTDESWPFVYRIKNGRTIIDGQEFTA